MGCPACEVEAAPHGRLFNWFFRKVCNKMFEQTDRNNDGRLDQVEVELAVLKIYNHINKRLPGWQDPPTRSTIQKAFQEYDVDKSGYLDQKEFYSFAHELVKTGPDTFFARIGRHAIVRTAIVPSASRFIQHVCQGQQALGLGKVADVPLHYLAPMVGVVFGAFRGLIPN